jgi:hypothetical protein
LPLLLHPFQLHIFRQLQADLDSGRVQGFQRQAGDGVIQGAAA